MIWRKLTGLLFGGHPVYIQVGQIVSHSFCPYLCQISIDFQLFSPETQLSWGSTFSNHVYNKFFTESAGENVLRIAQYLAKIRTQICGLLFGQPLRFNVETQYAWSFTWPLVTFLCVTCHVCIVVAIDNVISSRHYWSKTGKWWSWWIRDLHQPSRREQ